MTALDYPLDALVFDYASFGFFNIVNNVWTWVAVITAAVSFWRIRAGTGGGVISLTWKSEAEASPTCIERSVTQSTRPSAAPDSSSLPELSSSVVEPPSVPSPSSVTSPPVFDDNGVTRGKFVAYYEDDSDKSDDDDQGELAVTGDWEYGGDDQRCDDGEWWGSWEGVLKMRMGEMEWYRYQDVTAINGNVVRLWDGVRKEKCCFFF